MYSYNNIFADDSKKTLLWRVYLKSIDRNIFNTKISTNIKHFLKQWIVLKIPLPGDPVKYFYGEYI